MIINYAILCEIIAILFLNLGRYGHFILCGFVAIIDFLDRGYYGIMFHIGLWSIFNFFW